MPEKGFHMKTIHVQGKLYNGRIIFRIVMFMLSILMLLPFLWIISTSLRLPKDSFTLPPSFLPTSFHFENYSRVFSELPFFLFITNSMKVTFFTIFFQIIFSTMAAYAFSRIDFKGKTVLFLLILTGLMIPGQATIVPRFLIMRELNLMDNQLALILPGLIDPLSIFILRQFMITIPKSYDEAAFIDGASRARIYATIILPMTKPVIIVVIVMRLLVVWNDFFNPLIYISTFEKMTLPLGLTILQGYMGSGSISVILAGVTLSLIPPILMYMFGQKYLLQGVSLTGLKS